MRTAARPQRGPGTGGSPLPAPAWDLLLGDDGAAGTAGVPPALPGARNMALDELLLRRVSAGGRPALRFYGWDPPCLSLGRNQPAAGRVDLDAAARHGVDIVRRPTGGLAVLHHLELTYAVAVPVGLLGSPRETYTALCRALASGLRRLGAPAVVVGDVADAPPRPGPPPSARGGHSAPPPSARGAGAAPSPLAPGYLAATQPDARCFATAAPGEIAADGRKLVGSAQRREGRVLLQHGSILLDGGQDIVAELFGDGAGAAVRGDPPGRPTSLREVLGAAPSPAAVAAALGRGFQDVLGIGLAPAPLDAGDRDALAGLEARYRSDSWTWRR